jgi:sulfate-transporting ATPase
MPSDTQVIYSMMRVGRIHPPNRQVLKDISLGFYYGAKIGVLGLNGSGKSTLLRIMAGLDQDYIGEIAKSKGYSVGMLEQDPQLDPDKTVLQIVREGVQPVVDLLAEYDAVNEKFADPEADIDALVAEQAKLLEEIERVDAWNLDNHLEIAMEALRCPPPETSIAILSGGERRRVALTRLLLMEPDILLLDEPTNHLDAESVAWLERHLQDYKGTVIAVTHDRYFLDNVAGWILELDRGQGIPWKGNYSSWLEQKGQRLARRRPNPAASGHWPASWNGSGFRPKPARRKEKPGSPLTRICSAEILRSTGTSRRFRFRRGPAWGISSSISKASPRLTGIAS